MLQSNQPYQRVDDGVGSGFIGGALAGGAAAGATHMWGQKGLQTIGSKAMEKRAEADNKLNKMATIDLASNPTYNDSFDKYAKQFDRSDKTLKGVKKAHNLHNKGFGGGWKSKALTYGGSVIAGGILGMGADALND